MKKLLVILVLSLIFCVSCYSAEVTFVWDYSAEAQALLGASGQFKLYQSKTSGTYTGTPVAVVSAMERTVTINTAAGTYFWVLTASDGEGNESDYSNEVTAKIKPSKPSVLIIKGVK